MIVRMTTQMSGGRYDDRSWPTPWVNFEVPDEEGRGLVAAGVALEVVLPPEAKAPLRSLTVTPESAQASATASALPPPSPPPPAPPVTEEVPQPRPADPKDAWVEYAVSRGVSKAEAEAMTKAQLQAAYGSRM